MATKLEIINTALVHLGTEPLDALTDDRREATFADLRYDSVRDSLLRAHPWNFAMKRAQPSEAATNPTFEFSNAFVLPSDFLRLYTLNHTTSQDDYRIEHLNGSTVIATDASSIDILYIHQVADPQLFDPLFTEAFAALLARELAGPLTADEEKVQLMDRLYRSKLSEARTADAMENPPLNLDIDAFGQARLGGGRFRAIESP